MGEPAYYAWSTLAVSALLEKTGGVMSGGIDMNGSKVMGLAAPTANLDAATKKYVDDAITAAIASLGA